MKHQRISINNPQNLNLPRTPAVHNQDNKQISIRVNFRTTYNLVFALHLTHPKNQSQTQCTPSYIEQEVALRNQSIAFF